MCKGLNVTKTTMIFSVVKVFVLILGLGGLFHGKLCN